MIAQIWKLAFCYVALCSFGACSSSDSFTDTADSGIICPLSSEDQSVVQYCVNMSLPASDKNAAYFRIKLKSHDDLLHFKSTEETLPAVSMALERGLVETFQFVQMHMYASFDQKYLLDNVFVSIKYCTPDLDFSNIDFQYVDEMFVVILDPTAWLKNENFLNTKWKKLILYVYVASSEDAVCADLISRLDVEELEVSSRIDNMPWPELLNDSTVELREKIHLLLFSKPEHLPDVGFIKLFDYSRPKSIFCPMLESDVLPGLIQETSILKELEIHVANFSDLEKCEKCVKESDFSLIDREFKIVLTSETGERAEYCFASNQ